MKMKSSDRKQKHKKESNKYELEFNEQVKRINALIDRINALGAWSRFQIETREILTHPVFAMDSCEETFGEKCRLLNLLFNLKEILKKMRRSPEGKSKGRYDYFRMLLENVERRVAYTVGF